MLIKPKLGEGSDNSMSGGVGKELYLSKKIFLHHCLIDIIKYFISIINTILSTNHYALITAKGLSSTTISTKSF